MKRKIMACILVAALGITGVSFPAAAKTVSVGKNVKNITVNVKNPLDELRAQEAAMQQQEELEEEENMPEQDLDPLVLDNDGSEDIQTADGSISGELPADFSEGTENGDNGSEELQLQQENGNVETSQSRIIIKLMKAQVRHRLILQMMPMLLGIFPQEMLQMENLELIRL